MSYAITYEKILEEFRIAHSYFAAKMVDWYPSGRMEITIMLMDGTKLTYDYLNQMIRFLNNFEDNESVSEEEWMREFSFRLAKKMRQNRITQEELSETTGLSKPTISKYVNGRSIPNVYVARKIALALECSVSELIDFI